jgi:hypothetical protein
MRLAWRQVRWVPAVSVIALAGCATADLRPGVVPHESSKQIRAKFRGPDVSVRARVVNSYAQRLVHPTISLAESAYVVVGDIGDDGTLRILFPVNPGEPSLIQKTNRFAVPAFAPRMFFPMSSGVRAESRATAVTGAGNVFVIASFTPLHLERLVEGERWSLFDVYYDNHLNDPYLAITDLATAISSSVRDLSIAHAPYASGRFQVTRAPSRSDGAPMAPRRLPRPPS